MNLGIITHPEHSKLGWATSSTLLEAVVEELKEHGISTDIFQISDTDELHQKMDALRAYDLIWPNSYHVDDHAGRASLVKILEEEGVRFLGSGSQTLNDVLDKEDCQKILEEKGIPIPTHVAVENIRELERALSSGEISYPFIVKPIHSASSFGVTPDSVMRSPGRALEHGTKLFERFPDGLMLEDYIDGQEFTVLYVGDRKNAKIFPVHVLFPDQYGGVYPERSFFTQFDSEALTYHSVDPELLSRGSNHKNHENGVIFSAITDPSKVENLRELAIEVAKALGTKDYMRFDGRFNDQGKPYVIDVNGMPGLNPRVSISTQAVYACTPDLNNNVAYTNLLTTIVKGAMTRYEK